MEDVAVEAATAALRRLEPRRTRLRRVSECADPNDEMESENRKKNAAEPAAAGSCVRPPHLPLCARASSLIITKLRQLGAL